MGMVLRKSGKKEEGLCPSQGNDRRCVNQIQGLRAGIPHPDRPTYRQRGCSAAASLPPDRRAPRRRVLPFYNCRSVVGSALTVRGLNEWLARRHRSSLGGH